MLWSLEVCQKYRVGGEGGGRSSFRAVWKQSLSSLLLNISAEPDWTQDEKLLSWDLRKAKDFCFHSYTVKFFTAWKVIPSKCPQTCGLSFRGTELLVPWKSVINRMWYLWVVHVVRNISSLFLILILHLTLGEMFWEWDFYLQKWHRGVVCFRNNSLL